MLVIKAKTDALNRLIEAQKEKVRALRQAYDQNKAKLGENDAEPSDTLHRLIRRSLI